MDFVYLLMSLHVVIGHARRRVMAGLPFERCVEKKVWR
jgi:hypothetical protein